jgi:hypothetical protein
MSNELELSENILGVVHEVLRGWVEEIEPADLEEIDVAHLFGMLGTAGYSIVPNTTAPASDEVLAELEGLHGDAVYGTWYARGSKVFVDYGDNTYCVLEEGEISGGDHPGTSAAFAAAIKNAAPALLARVRQAEARLARLEEFYEGAQKYAAPDDYSSAWAMMVAGFDGDPTVKGGQQDA